MTKPTAVPDPPEQPGDGQPPEGPERRPFAAVLQEQRQGSLHAELSDELANISQAVIDLNKSGTLTLTLKINPAGKGQAAVFITDEVKAKPPVDKQSSMFFTDGKGNLTRRNPNQTSMPVQLEGGLADERRDREFEFVRDGELAVLLRVAGADVDVLVVAELELAVLELVARAEGRFVRAVDRLRDLEHRGAVRLADVVKTLLDVFGEGLLIHELAVALEPELPLGRDQELELGAVLSKARLGDGVGAVLIDDGDDPAGVRRNPHRGMPLDAVALDVGREGVDRSGPHGAAGPVGLHSVTLEVEHLEGAILAADCVELGDVELLRRDGLLRGLDDGRVAGMDGTELGLKGFEIGRCLVVLRHSWFLLVEWSW